MIVGVDVGGTFTDLLVLDEATGAITVSKVPSVRTNEAVGFLNGLDATGAALADVSAIVHGTTVGTNALLERKGATTAAICTAGFADVLEMRRRDRPQTWGLWGTFEPVVSRDRRAEVAERVLADGSIHTAIDPDEVRAIARRLADEGAEAVAITFLHSYANDANEAAAVAAVREVWPNEHVSASIEILPEIREFERSSTTALNAYLQPVVGNYLAKLESALAEAGFDGEFLIVQSNGGVMTAPTARRLPVRTALSGPAAGVIASGRLAQAAGFPNVITCDLGGTSFDVAVIADGESTLSAQTTIDFGMVIRTPMVEITTIGAGGGSIADVDAGGILRVGPESAGSVPGPACYGRGNDRPTLTDANLVLGRIDGASPIGGLDRLDPDAARNALETHVGKPLGLDIEDAAEAVIEVANAAMAGAIRLVSVERGHDPSAFAAMPFGGGGALHAGALLVDVGLAAALVPRYPGVNSALGCVIADLRHDVVRTIRSPLDQLDVDRVRDAATRAETDGNALIDSAGVPIAAVDVVHELDMSYIGQTHTVAVPIDVGPRLDQAAIAAAFSTAYERIYGRLLDGLDLQVLNVRSAVIGRRPRFDLSVLAPPDGTTVDGSLVGTRPVRFDGTWHDTPLYDRLSLPLGATVHGPAVLGQPDATILIEPGLVGTVDPIGNVVIRRTP